MEKIIEKLTQAVSRRRFLTRLSAAAAAFALGVLGLSDVAHAGCPPGTVRVACCCLCKRPGTCVYGSCACQWSWPCEWTDGSVCREYTCWECYSSQGSWCDPDGPDGACNQAKCSRATYRTIPCL